MRIFCITINSFTLIPVTRFILGFFASRYRTEIVECKIARQYEIEKVAKHKTIGTFSNSADLNSQSQIFKVWKHVIIIKKFASLLFKKDVIIYTPDLTVLVYGLWCKIKLNRKNWKIIYHQFELIETRNLKGKDKLCWVFLLNNAQHINLFIFPEINRLKYFSNLANINSEQLLLFANTCSSQKTLEIEKYPGLPDFKSTDIVFGHIGNVGPDHYFKEFISLIEKLSSHKDVYFIVAGRYSDDIIEEFRAIKNTNLIFLGELPHSELMRIYAYVDYGFILYKGIDLNFEFCAPNKLYEYWSFGIPVLAHPLTGLKTFFDDPVKGRLLDFNGKNLIYELTSILKDPKPDKLRLKRLFDSRLTILNELSKLDGKLANIV